MPRSSWRDFSVLSTKFGNLRFALVVQICMMSFEDLDANVDRKDAKQEEKNKNVANAFPAQLHQLTKRICFKRRPICIGSKSQN